MRAGDENEEDSTLEFNPSSSAAFMKFNWIASHTVGGEIVDLDKTKIELSNLDVFSDVYQIDDVKQRIMMLRIQNFLKKKMLLTFSLW